MHPSDLPRTFQLETYNYNLPEHFIAQSPLPMRDHSKLLCRKSTGEIFDQKFSDLPYLIPENALLVTNSSKVFPCRIRGHFNTGGKFELFLLSCIEDYEGRSLWTAIGKPLKQLRLRGVVDLGGGLEVQFVRDANENAVVIEISTNKQSVMNWLDVHGEVPLPPYIHRTKSDYFGRNEDFERYQTIYAKATGSTAAPTAGLHFTSEIFSTLSARQIEIAEVLLHVGTGTFLPVKTSDIRLHQMHSEAYTISEKAFAQIERAKLNNRPIVTVGTTSLRCLESFYRLPITDRKSDIWFSTDLFLHPTTNQDHCLLQSGVAGLVTNFHQPKSTLFMLVCSLIGLDQALKTYEHAVEQKYRFLSYGDACYFELGPTLFQDGYQ